MKHQLLHGPLSGRNQLFSEYDQVLSGYGKVWVEY